MAVIGVFVKVIGTRLNNFTVLFFRFAVSTLVMLPIIEPVPKALLFDDSRCRLFVDSE